MISVPISFLVLHSHRYDMILILNRYLRLYGRKFSKEDHVLFIKLLYELVTIPKLEISMMQSFARLLINLLKYANFYTKQMCENVKMLGVMSFFLTVVLYFIGRKNYCPVMTWSCLGGLCTISMRVSCTPKPSILVLTGSQSRSPAHFLTCLSVIFWFTVIRCELWLNVWMSIKQYFVEAGYLLA